MSNDPNAYLLETEEPATLPYESIPQLSTNEDFINKMARLRELKRQLDAITPELEELKLECGAMLMVADVKSVAFIDLRLTNAAGAQRKGKVTGAGVLDFVKGDITKLTPTQIYGILLATRDIDEREALKSGVPAHMIAASREPGTTAAGSTRLEWVGAKGKGANSRKAGSGGPVQ